MALACACGLDGGVYVEMHLLSQPRHLDDDQRHPRHGPQGDRGTSEYRQGLKVMNGGFTLSGGEPLMQHRFAVKLFAAARGMGIHTTLDTNGYYGARLTDDELGLIDLVMLDIKTWDSEWHTRFTGMDVGPTLEFARRLAARAQSADVAPGTCSCPGLHRRR